MAAFISLLDRRGDPVDQRLLDRLAAPLAARHLTASSLCRGPFGITVLHPASGHARHRHGPLVCEETGVVLAVAGRFGLSGRSLPQGLPAGDPGVSGPAAWALAAGVASDPRPLAAVCGPFALVAADPAATLMNVSCDHLAALAVYYYLDDRWLVAASDPAAILHHPAVGSEIDEESVARYLGFRFSAADRSFFRRIRQLPPGHRLEVTATAIQCHPYWRFRRLRGLGRRAGSEIRADFLARLGAAIERETAGLPAERVAVSLSGGLDSTAVAALAPAGVQAFSWTFDTVPEADERAHVEKVAGHLDLPLRQISGEGLHPLSGDFVERFASPGSPHLNPFAALKARLYDAARSAGCQRVLVGDAGDALYSAAEYWLRDLLAHRQPGALASLGHTLRRAWRGDGHARGALRCLLPLRLPLPLLGARRVPWLTPAARRRLPAQDLAPSLPRSRTPRRYELSLGLKHITLESEERRCFRHYGIERSNPFWSWPLLELVSQLPAYWYYRDGTTKVLTREALRGRLPERILASPRQGSLGSFFLRGIEASRRAIQEAVFSRPCSDWPRWVDRRWLEPHFADTREVRFGHTILWYVISYELWQRRLQGVSWPGGSA